MLDRYIDDLFTILVCFLIMGTFSLVAYFLAFYIPHKIQTIKIRIYNRRKQKKKEQMRKIIERVDTMSLDELCEFVDSM